MSISYKLCAEQGNITCLVVFPDWLTELSRGCFLLPDWSETASSEIVVMKIFGRIYCRELYSTPESLKGSYRAQRREELTTTLREK